MNRRSRGMWVLGSLLLCLAAQPLNAQTQRETLPNPFDFVAPQPADEPPAGEGPSAFAPAAQAAAQQEPKDPATEPKDPATEPFGPPPRADEIASEPDTATQPAASTRGTGDSVREALAEDEEAVEAAPSDEVAQAAAAPQAAAGQKRDAVVPPPAADAVDQVLQQQFERALLIDVNGPIFDRFHWYLNNRLDLAKAQRVDLIIIRLTSPGGELDHSLQLARRLRDIDWATTVAFIPEEAISGGAMIALGCDRIYMQPGALLGDAGPIRMGLGGQFEHAEEKIVSYTVSAIRELAAGQDRPAALAEAMVDRGVTVYQAVEIATGKRVFLSEKEFNEARVAEKYELGPAIPETGQNRFLTLGAARARELQMCEGVFASEADLLDQLEIVSLERTQLNWVDKTVFTLNRPWLTALLLIVGLIGLYLELAAPGLSIAGLSSMVCFGIFFWSHALGGTAGWLEVLLFFLGICCLAIELFVLPGFGLFGLSGLVLVVFSLVMASQDFVIPHGAAEWGEFRVNLLIVLGSVLGVMVLFFGQILLLDTIPGLNRFRLAAPAGEGFRGEEATPNLLQAVRPLGLAALDVGAAGVAESDLRPSGKVFIGDRLWDVITEGDYVEAGSRVEVLRVEGNRVVVRKL